MPCSCWITIPINNNSSIYWNPNYNWSDAITRLRGAVLVANDLARALRQSIMGMRSDLVGPVTFDTETNTWQDDPYNRQPFPGWDQALILHTTLIYKPRQARMLYAIIYTLLTSTRNTHPALRTGSFDPLLWDHPSVYAFGRRSLDPADAAVVVLNRSTQAQSVTLDLSGYLPATLILVDVLHNNASYTIASDGSLSLIMYQLCLVCFLFMPAVISPLQLPHLTLLPVEGESQVNLTWSAVLRSIQLSDLIAAFSPVVVMSC